ncbi:MAG: hypothetical protein HKM24_06590, partial [Gammaproteobacteria bacterium]|nr:hypothetical protein [Gammaproteobacteria bacterium]
MKKFFYMILIACFLCACNNHASEHGSDERRIIQKAEMAKKNIQRAAADGQDVRPLIQQLMFAKKQIDSGNVLGGEKIIDHLLQQIDSGQFVGLEGFEPPPSGPVAHYTKPQLVALQGYGGQAM